MGIVNVSTVVGNKVTKTVFEKKQQQPTTVENNSRCSERALLGTQSSELFDILVLRWSYERRDIMLVEQ